MNLIEGIQKECNRVREIIPMYKAIGIPGAFGVTMMEASIERAERAVANDDMVAMVRAYKDLESHTG